MLQLAQAIAYHLSFLDGGVTSGLVGVAARLWSVTEIANAAQASLSSLVAPLQNISNAWSGREQQLNNISRSLRQYGYIGQTVANINRDIAQSMPGASEAQRAGRFTEVYQNQFNQARQFSRGIVRQMSADAAILPGELNDYMESFQMNLPFLAQVRGMTLQRATHLTNYLTAGAVAAGIDAPQSARDLMQALTTGAHIVDKSWTNVWSNYARFRGKRISTPAEFNRLTQEQKVTVLEDVASQLQPMMDATGDAYEAIMGTFRSLQHELYLEASEPLFEAWKKTMLAVNEQLSILYPILAGVGRYFATLGAGVIDKVTQYVRHFSKALSDAAPALQQVGARISNFIAGELLPTLVRIYNPLATAVRFAGSLLWRAGGLLFDVVMAYVWPAFQFASEKAVSLGGTLRASGVAAHEAVVTAFRVLGGAVGQASSIFDIIGPSIEVWRFSLEVASLYMREIFVPMITFFVGNVGTIFRFFQSAIQYAQIGFNEVTTYLDELARSGSVLAQVFLYLSNTLREIPNTLLGGMGGSIFDVLRSDAEGSARAQEGAMRQVTATIPDWMLAIQKSISSIGKGDADLGRTGRGDRTNRPHATQDFRYSRFDITQRFEEGFSPDRVASAFASDLEAMASQRLSSGFAPAFSLP